MRPPSSAPRRLVQAAAALLVCAVGLLALINLGINIALPQLINTRPQRVEVRWTAAWMLIPGHIEVRGLRVRGQGPSLAWVVSAEQASGVVSLKDLTRRRFVAHTVRGQGVRFEASPRPDDAPPLPPPPEHRWQVRLDDIEVPTLDEVRLGAWRSTGPARARAQLSIDHPHLDARITVALPGGEVDLGGTPLARDLRGEVSLRVEHLDRRASAADKLRALSATARLQAEVQDLRFLDALLAKIPWLRLSGSGTATVEASVERGVLRTGSAMQTTFPALEAHVASNRVTGSGRLTAAVVSDDLGQPRLDLAVDFDDFTVLAQGQGEPLATGDGFHVGLSTPDVVLYDGVHTVTGEVVLPSSRVPDASVYDHLLPQGIGLSLHGGTGTASGRLRVSSEDGGSGSGELTIEGDELDVVLDSLSIRADVTLNARLADARVEDGHYDLSGSSLSLRQTGVINDERPDPSDGERLWSATISVVRGTIDVGAPTYLDATLRLQCSDSAPFIAVFAQKRDLPRWFQGVLTVRDVTSEARLRLGPTSLNLDPAVLRAGGDVQVDLRYRLEAGDRHGALLAQAGPLSIGIALHPGGSKLRLFGAKQWWEDGARSER